MDKISLNYDQVSLANRNWSFVFIYCIFIHLVALIVLVTGQKLELNIDQDFSRIQPSPQSELILSTFIWNPKAFSHLVWKGEVGFFFLLHVNRMWKEHWNMGEVHHIYTRTLLLSWPINKNTQQREKKNTHSSTVKQFCCQTTEGALDIVAQAANTLPRQCVRGVAKITEQKRAMQQNR